MGSLYLEEICRFWEDENGSGFGCFVYAFVVRP